MQAAKDAIKDFIHRDQKHDTEVQETFNPAVTKERVHRQEAEEATTAIDRERHQDHYQTRIQPIEDRTVLPEEHRHNILPVEHREHRKVNDKEVQHKLDEERRRFQSTREVLPVERTHTEGTAVTGEHTHHHVYENVQPIIEREVVQPAVIHTTRPIHEKIIHEPSFHSPTVQPKMTLEEYKRVGGVLNGKKQASNVFEGEPKIKENGGADRTHPSVTVGGGRHNHSTGHSTGASRPGRNVLSQ